MKLITVIHVHRKVRCMAREVHPFPKKALELGFFKCPFRTMNGNNNLYLSTGCSCAAIETRT